MKSAEYVIIGGGPTGLGAAHRLCELNQSDWVLLEKSGSLGGLASSVVDGVSNCFPRYTMKILAPNENVVPVPAASALLERVIVPLLDEPVVGMACT